MAIEHWMLMAMAALIGAMVALLYGACVSHKDLLRQANDLQRELTMKRIQGEGDRVDGG